MKKLTCEKHNRILIGKEKCLDCEPIKKGELKRIAYQLGFKEGYKKALLDVEDLLPFGAGFTGRFYLLKDKFTITE